MQSLEVSSLPQDPDRFHGSAANNVGVHYSPFRSQQQVRPSAGELPRNSTARQLPMPHADDGLKSLREAVLLNYVRHGGCAHDLNCTWCARSLGLTVHLNFAWRVRLDTIHFGPTSTFARHIIPQRSPQHSKVSTLQCDCTIK